MLLELITEVLLRGDLQEQKQLKDSDIIKAHTIPGDNSQNR